MPCTQCEKRLCTSLERALDQIIAIRIQHQEPFALLAHIVKRNSLSSPTLSQKVCAKMAPTTTRTRLTDQEKMKLCEEKKKPGFSIEKIMKDYSTEEMTCFV